MKTLLFLTTLALASCTAPTEWAGTPNPLDKPGDDGSLPTVEEMHLDNIRWITKNPAYR